MKTARISLAVATLACALFILFGCTEKGNIDSNIEINNGATDIQSQPIEKEIDFNAYFKGLNGSAVFYDYNDDEYFVYNKDAAETRYSPCSTFKIISAIAGLENGVISGSNSTMKYSGAIYAQPSWNENLTLSEAFKTSCVWYFRQVADDVGQEKIAVLIEDLGYGNKDISAWGGGNINPTADTNGFWIESSLEISPREQADLMARIFEGNTAIKDKTISVLESMMKADIVGASIYGKTGTGKNNAWYVGFFEEDAGRCYFAVNLQDKVRGKQAQEIAATIIKDYFIKGK